VERESREHPDRREQRDQILDDDLSSTRRNREAGNPELRDPEAAEEERKAQARQEYILAGFSPRKFEEDWPVIRARLATEEIARRWAMADPEPGSPSTGGGGLRGSRDLWGRRGAPWIAAVIIILIILWFWWIAIWGFGAWGTGANQTRQQIPQNQPVQQAPQNQR
jgi:hypothetical protein